MIERPSGLWRFRLVFGLLMLAVPALGVRIVQLLSDDQAKARAAVVLREQRMTTPLLGRMGDIFARAGHSFMLLAGSRTVPSCHADPGMMQEKDLAATAVRLGGIVHMDPVRLYEKFVLRRDSRFIWIKRDLPPAEANAILAARMPGVGIAQEWRREYPNGQLASTVLGFRRTDSATTAGGGLELSQQALLAQDGRRVALADAARRPIWQLFNESTQPADGKHLLLTLDMTIQGFLDAAMADSVTKYEAKWGVGVVVDPQTGMVLAMSSYPTFNPNVYTQAKATDRTNRVISMPYEPGSALKPVYAAAAVQEGVVTWDTMIFCENGDYEAAKGGHISDHGNHYGTMSLRDVVVHSSNIGMAKVGEKLGLKREYYIAKYFGLGQKTYIGLPGEDAGIVRDLKKMDGYSLRRVPFGQEISVTALQLAMAYCAIANGGELLQPQIVDRVTDSSFNTLWQCPRQVVRRVLSPQVAAQAVDVMAEVVERGTGKACKMDRWSSFGKTGTAQIQDPVHGGYAEGAFTSTFVGGAPVGKPRLLCLISVYWPNRAKGHFGATVSAPYVKQVLEQSLAYLNVPPDQGAPATASPVVAAGGGHD